MAKNANDLFTDLMWKLKHFPAQDSRNGRVRCELAPVLYRVSNPTQRVLFNPKRKANPYFHVMETVWMFAGAQKIDFLLPFNKNIVSYAEEDGRIHGAYGHRWREHFGTDQIVNVINQLTQDIHTRQAVINMWDAETDFRSGWKDRPCNTTIYFRVVGGCLDMTVCNRSNDAVWGLAGANIVHMTYLLELVARAIKVPVGIYHIMTNNLHIYEPHWHLMENPQTHDYYHDNPHVTPYPLLRPKDDWWELLVECEMFVKSKGEGVYQNAWLEYVVKPMYEHYMCRLNGDKDTYNIEENMAPDWRQAEYLWREWHA